MTRKTLLFGTGPQAEARAHAYLDALREASGVTASGPPLPRCERLTGNVRLGSRAPLCGCTDAASPVPGCPYVLRDVGEAWRLPTGQVAVLLPELPAAAEGERRRGLDLSPSRGAALPDQARQPEDVSDLSTRILDRS